MFYTMFENGFASQYTCIIEIFKLNNEGGLEKVKNSYDLKEIKKQDGKFTEIHRGDSTKLCFYENNIFVGTMIEYEKEVKYYKKGNRILGASIDAVKAFIK